MLTTYKGLTKTQITGVLTAAFDREAKAAAPFYPKICTIAPSDGEEENYGWLGDMPGAREWLGERIFHELRAATLRIRNKHWESSLLIPRTTIADNKVGNVPFMLEQLAVKAMSHPDILLFDALNNGAAGLCYDGQPFFDADHTWGDSGTQSNAVTSSVVDSDNVTALEMKLAIRRALRQLLTFKDDRGDYLINSTVENLKGLILLVPPSLREQAYDVLESKILGGTGDSNVITNKLEITCSPLLSDPKKFFIFRTDQALKPFVFQAREPLKRQVKFGKDEPGLESKSQDSHDIEGKDVKFMTEARYSLGYLMWQCAIQTTFETVNAD